MGFRTRTAVGLATAVAGLTMVVAPAGPAAAYDFPSTNEINRAAGLPHVNEVSKGPGTVTLEFVNATNSLAYFEYRIDGQTQGTTTHPVVDGDVIHPGVCVDGRSASLCSAGPEVETFTAMSKVEIRLALGGERDWDFNWTEFTVGEKPAVPTTADDCKNGGWEAFGFRNQGQCIRFVNTGKPSAAPPAGENRGHENRLESDDLDRTPHSAASTEPDPTSETVLPEVPPVPGHDEATDRDELGVESDETISGPGKSDAAKSGAAKDQAPKGPPSRWGNTG